MQGNWTPFARSPLYKRYFASTYPEKTGTRCKRSRPSWARPAAEQLSPLPLRLVAGYASRSLACCCWGKQAPRLHVPKPWGHCISSAGHSQEAGPCIWSTCSTVVAQTTALSHSCKWWCWWSKQGGHCLGRPGLGAAFSIGLDPWMAPLPCCWAVDLGIGPSICLA